MDAKLPDVPKSKRAPIVVWEAAAVVFYDPRDRGWYVRRYHSSVAMKAHLKGGPPPKHWGKPKGWDWRLAYADTGVFTKKEALEDVEIF